MQFSIACLTATSGECSKRSIHEQCGSGGWPEPHLFFVPARTVRGNGRIETRFPVPSYRLSVQLAIRLFFVHTEVANKPPEKLNFVPVFQSGTCRSQVSCGYDALGL
jgi:hypothetical protein